MENICHTVKFSVRETIVCVGNTVPLHAHCALLHVRVLF